MRRVMFSGSNFKDISFLPMYRAARTIQSQHHCDKPRPVIDPNRLRQGPLGPHLLQHTDHPD